MNRRVFSLGGLLSVVGCGRKSQHATTLAEAQAQMSHGRLDSMLTYQLHARLSVAKDLQRKFPGESLCGRCLWPWAVLTCHATMLEEKESGGYGIFCLCEDCWKDLQTWENRIPYYRELVFSDTSGWGWREWPRIQAAVIAEDKRPENKKLAESQKN